METIFETIIEIFILILFRYPGAFIRWILIGRKKTFKQILSGDSYLNGSIGLVFVVLIIVFLVKLIK